MAAQEPGARGVAERDAALDAAFAAVLAAERAAEEAVAGCRAEAQRRLAEAEDAARRLAERVAVRRSGWRERRTPRLVEQLAELRRQTAAAAGPVALDASARARLASAVERLADELCGGDAEAP